MSGYESGLQKVKELFNEDKLFQAGRLLDDLILKDGEKAAAWLEEDDELRRMKEECECARLMMERMQGTDGWNLSYNGGGTKVWHKPEQGTPFHSLRSEAVLEADMLMLLSLIYETDFHCDIFKFLKAQELLARPSRARKVVRSIFGTPWPLQPRECLIYGYAIDGYDEDNCWLVYFRDLEPVEDDLTWVERTAGTTHMRVRYAGLLLEPVAPGQTRVVNVANLDAQVPLVTPKILNWLGRSIFRHTLRILESKAQSFGSMPHAERMETDPLYNWLRDRTEEFLARWDDDDRAGGESSPQVTAVAVAARQS